MFIYFPNMLRKTPLRRSSKPLKRTKLRRVSKKRAVENAEYAKRRKVFLAKPENQWCPVARARLLDKTNPEYEALRPIHREVLWQTSEIHHMKRRQGKLLNDERYWLAVSSEGHRWIESNPNEARERGWLV